MQLQTNFGNIVVLTPPIGHVVAVHIVFQWAFGVVSERFRSKFSAAILGFATSEKLNL